MKNDFCLPLLVAIFYCLSAIIFTLIVDCKKINKIQFKMYSIGFILIIITALILSNVFEALGGITLAVLPAFVIYKMYNKKMYSAFIFYLSYMSFYLPDLYLGYITTNLFKVDFNIIYTNVNYTILYYIGLAFGCLIFAILNNFIVRKIKVREIVVSRKVDNILTLLLIGASVFQMLFTIYVRSNNISAKAVSNSLITNSAIVIFVMYIIFYILQECQKDYLKIKKENAEYLEEINRLKIEDQEDAEAFIQNLLLNDIDQEYVKSIEKIIKSKKE